MKRLMTRMRELLQVLQRQKIQIPAQELTSIPKKHTIRDPDIMRSLRMNLPDLQAEQLQALLAIMIHTLKVILITDTAISALPALRNSS